MLRCITSRKVVLLENVEPLLFNSYVFNGTDYTVFMKCQVHLKLAKY